MLHPLDAYLILETQPAGEITVYSDWKNVEFFES